MSVLEAPIPPKNQAPESAACLPLSVTALLTISFGAYLTKSLRQNAPCQRHNSPLANIQQFCVLFSRAFLETKYRPRFMSLSPFFPCLLYRTFCFYAKVSCVCVIVNRSFNSVSFNFPFRRRSFRSLSRVAPT